MRFPSQLCTIARRLLPLILGDGQRQPAQEEETAPAVATLTTVDLAITLAIFADRPTAAERFLGQMRAAAAGMPNRYVERVAAVADVDALQRAEERALAFLRRQVEGLRTVDVEGNIVPAGMPELARAYQHLVAVDQRRQEIARQE